MTEVDNNNDCMEFSRKDQEIIRAILRHFSNSLDNNFMDIQQASALCDNYESVELFLMDIIGCSKTTDNRFLIYNAVEYLEYSMYNYFFVLFWDFYIFTDTRK